MVSSSRGKDEFLAARYQEARRERGEERGELIYSDFTAITRRLRRNPVSPVPASSRGIQSTPTTFRPRPSLPVCAHLVITSGTRDPA